MKKVFAKLAQYRQERGMQVWVKSVDLIPIGARTGRCRLDQKDWRQPALIHAFNRALKRLSTEFRVALLDMRDILEPVWDAAVDYSHPRDETLTVLSRYLLSQTLFPFLNNTAAEIRTRDGLLKQYAGGARGI